MKTIESPREESWQNLSSRPTQSQQELESKVRPILDDIRDNGEKSLLSYARQFDKFEGDTLRVPAQEIAAAGDLVSEQLKEAIKIAVQNIEKFHASQSSEVKEITTSSGVSCWRKNIAVEKVGLYIPSGTAPLFSTVLMLAIPARLAGCDEIVLCSPPYRGTFEESEPEDKYLVNSGSIHPAILYCCHILGISEVFRVGGAHAIAAMAYGTESVPKVDKIFGPGNQYVTCAKQLVSREGGAIDLPAGPSEVLVIADESANPKFVAADLLSQAEHGPDSQVVLVSTSRKFIEDVHAEIDGQITRLDRQLVARASLEHSMAIYLESTDLAMAFSNIYAPEHLILAVKDARELADKVKNAGSVFLGHWTPESAGDYASGTNHTLPTSGYARAYSGVSLDSFVKKVTFQEMSREGLLELGPTVAVMAEAEQLEAHREAVNIRLREIKNV